MAVNQEELETQRSFGSDRKGLPDDSRLELAFLLPRTPEELRHKRQGLYGMAEGASAFADGWSDYAHSLLAGWYAHERYALAEDGLAAADGSTGASGAEGTWRQLYERWKRKRTVVTTSLHPVASLSGDEPIVHEAPHGGVRLNGRQRFGPDALLADELLVFVREEGEAEPSTAALIPKDAEGVNLPPIVGDDALVRAGGSVTAVYENVHIPQERLLIKQDAGRLKRLLGHPLVKSLADYQWAARQLDSIELLTGTAFALAEQTGLNVELHIQGELGELIQGVETLKALLHAAEIGAGPSPAGVLLPALPPLQAARKAGIDYYGKAVHVLQRIGAAAFLGHSNVSTGFGGDEGKPSLLQLAWQLAGSSDAARRKLHEQHAFGDPLAQSQELYRHYPVPLLRGRYREFWQAVQSIASDNDTEVQP